MNRLKSGKIVLGTLSLLMTASCFVSKSEGQMMASEIDRLKNEIATLQRQRSDSEILQERKHEEIAGRFAALENVTFKKAAAEGAESERLKKELAELRGQLEETQKNIETIKPTTPSSEPEETVPSGKKEHFDWAKGAFAAKNYGAAFSRADSFIDKYKNDKTYGADIYLLKGDAAMMLGKGAPTAAAALEWNKKALASYQEFLTRFSGSTRVPEGLYKVGDTMRAMGYASDARIFYEEIVQKHAKSEYAKQAKIRLSEMTAKKKKK